MSLDLQKILALANERTIADAVEKKHTELTCGSDGKLHQFFTFKPRPLLEYQKYIFRCDATTIALIGGNQIGKTLCGKRFVVARMLGYDPLYPERKFKCPIKVWACTKGDLLEGLFDEILEMVPPGMLKKKSVRRSPGRFEFELINGSFLQMKSFDQDREAMQQAKCDIVWWDEEGPKDHWVELQVRLVAMGGIFLLTLTPVKGTTWLHEKLFRLAPEYKNALSGRFAWFTGSPLDNDTLDKDRLQQLIDECQDENEYKIRILGIYETLAGGNAFNQEALARQQEFNKRAPKHVVNFTIDGDVFDVEPGYQGWKIFEDPLPYAGYAIGVDISEGFAEKNDYCTVVVVKVANNQVVATWKGRQETHDFGVNTALAGRWYNFAIICPEVNKQGASFLDALRSVGYPNIYRRETFGGKIRSTLQSEGWHTDGFSKPKMVNDLRRIIATDQIEIPSGEVLEELGNYIQLRKDEPGYHGFRARSGHDDFVTALGLAIQATRQGFISTRTTNQVVIHRDRGKAYKEALEIPYDTPGEYHGQVQDIWTDDPF